MLVSGSYSRSSVISAIPAGDGNRLAVSGINCIKPRAEAVE